MKPRAYVIYQKLDKMADRYICIIWDLIFISNLLKTAYKRFMKQILKRKKLTFQGARKRKAIQIKIEMRQVSRSQTKINSGFDRCLSFFEKFWMNDENQWHNRFSFNGTTINEFDNSKVYRKISFSIYLGYNSKSTFLLHVKGIDQRINKLHKIDLWKRNCLRAYHNSDNDSAI